jgi:hypothetical protein
MKKNVIMPMRFTCLTPDEQREQALFCVVAYYGGYCGWQSLILGKSRRKNESPK